jgi:hypothetical protein
LKFFEDALIATSLFVARAAITHPSLPLRCSPLLLGSLF